MFFGLFKKKKPAQADTNPQQSTSGTTSPPKKETQSKKKTTKAQQEVVADIGEDQWIYDTVVQFLSSPVWQIPILTFLDENCIIFDDEEENKFEYTQVHEDFKKIVEGLMDDMICEVQISEEKLSDIIKYGLQHPHDRKLFEQLLIIDNFQVFRNLMIKRNKQLELETLQQLYEIEKQKGTAPPVEQQENLQRIALENEQAEIEHALALSLAVQQEMAKMNEQEDFEMQEALRQSQVEYEKHQATEKERERQVQVEKEKALALTQQREKEEQARKQAEAEMKAKLAEAKAREAEALAKEAEAKAKEASPPKTSSTQNVEEEKAEPFMKQPSKKLEPLSNAPKPTGIKPAEEQRTSSLPPLAVGGKFQPMTIDQLLAEKDNVDSKIQQIKQEEPTVQTESLEERKKRLKAQRDLILAKKKAEREAELKNYEAQKEAGGKAEGKAEPAISAEEAEKRKEVHQKLKNV